MANVRVTGFVNENGVTTNKTPSSTGDALISNSDLIPMGNNAQHLGTNNLQWLSINCNQANFSGLVDINHNVIRIRNTKTPSSATDNGEKGSICYDADYLYVCVETNTWKRIGLSGW
jgi:hypothetical protein